jgi:hypothetical protein
MSTIAVSTPHILGTEAVLHKFIQPVGSGGLLGRIGRMILMVCTGGFIFPNVWVEGMNPTKIDWESQRGVREAAALKR